MALLTAEEKAKLSKEGIWVKEKCDQCGKPILSPVTFLRKGKVLCAGCAKGQDLTMSNIKEENEMKVKKAAAKQSSTKGESQSKKVGGYLIAGSAIADLYELLSDGKKHTFTEGNKICARHKKDLKGRLGNLGRVGIRKKAWGLIVDDEDKTIQMKLGKPAEAAFGGRASKSESSSKKTTSKKEQEPEEKGAMPSKALKATMALVRRTLKAGKDWTKNKLIEHLKSEHDQDPKRVEAALKEEIKAGGIEVEDGILGLV